MRIFSRKICDKAGNFFIKIFKKRFVFRYIFFTAIAVLFSFSQINFVHAVAGQRWDIIPPATFDQFTNVQISCDNYVGDPEGIIIDPVTGLTDFTLYINGAPPPCGQKFNLYNALTEITGAPLYAETEVWVCLSDGQVTGGDCYDAGDDSLIHSKFHIV